jgi:nucleotide-binding universal stress UspA family protein
MASPNLLTQIFKQLELFAKENLKEVAEKIRAEGLEVETIIGRGQPAQLIHEKAQKGSCNLIIIGTHGETGNP